MSTSSGEQRSRMLEEVQTGSILIVLSKESIAQLMAHELNVSHAR